MPNWASLVRLLRRRLVLGIIFALSLTYCAISLLSHEKLGNSLRRIRVQDDPDGNMFADNQDSPIADYNDNGDEEIFKGSAKDIGWQLEMENNYETENDDAIDNTRANLDSNDTFVIARSCRNSIQGKALIVDERGFVCSRSELLPTGCCSLTPLKKAKEEIVDETARFSPKRKRYSCETCNAQGCCAIYEYCVSCCLQPGKRRGKKNMGERERRDSLKGRARDEDAIRPRLRNLDRFQICLATCRTSSASVQHENTYKDPDSKHCYSQYQRHRRDDNLLKNNNGDNSIVVVTPSSTLRLFIRQRLLYSILNTDFNFFFNFSCFYKKNNRLVSGFQQHYDSMYDFFIFQQLYGEYLFCIIFLFTKCLFKMILWVIKFFKSLFMNNYKDKFLLIHLNLFDNFS